MKNHLFVVDDEPTGTCLQNGGINDCEKWPDLIPSPCCWMSCSELCGAACFHLKTGHGKECPDYGGERSECSGTCQNTGHEQKRVASA